MGDTGLSGCDAMRCVYGGGVWERIEQGNEDLYSGFCCRDLDMRKVG